MARQAYEDGSTEVIQVAVGKLADEPAVRELVTQQGTSMAGETSVRSETRLHTADARRGAPRPYPLRRPPSPAIHLRRLLRRLRPLGLRWSCRAAYGRPAGFVSRLVAFVTDVAIVTLGCVILGGVIALILNFFGLGAQQLQAGSSGQILQLIRTLTVVLSGLAVVLFVPLYFIVFWSLTGATPGHLLMGLRVVHGYTGDRLAARPPALHRLFPVRATAVSRLLLGHGRPSAPGLA